MIRSHRLFTMLLFSYVIPATAAQLGSTSTFVGGGTAGAKTTAGAGTYIANVPMLEHTFDLTNLPASFTYTLDSSQPNFDTVAALLTNGVDDSIKYFFSIGAPPTSLCCGGVGSEKQSFFPISAPTDFQGFVITSVVFTLDQFNAPVQSGTQFWNFRETVVVNGELPSPVPEPSSLALIGPALLAGGYWASRRSR